MAHSTALVKNSSSKGTDVEIKVKNLERALTDMPSYMRRFSNSMLSLYVEKAVGTNAEAARKFRKLRDDTRNDAMVYLKQVLPVSKELVSSIQSYFEYYQELDIDEWFEGLPAIIEEVHSYRQMCEVAVKMHESILTPLKVRANQAKEVMKELTELQKEYEETKERLQAKADFKRGWAIAFMFIPGLNLIASPILARQSDNALAEAVATGAQAKTQEAAALLVQDQLIPALSSFIGGLECAAGFFQIIENELNQLARKGEVAKSGKDSPVELHYTMMNKKAAKIIPGCQEFMFILPSVRTDFEAIPSEGTDQNYIDRWLEKQKKIINDTCTKPSTVERLFKMLMPASNEGKTKALTAN